MLYSNLDQVLHRQFLERNSLTKFLFDRLVKKSNKSNSLRKNSHVFITGLARSGTTALLNKIYSSGEFSSLIYKYMPFILSPKLAYLYSKFFANSHYKDHERMHKDGIKISLNSPECLDEIFWIHADKKYKSHAALTNSKINKICLDYYSCFLNSYSKFHDNNRLVIKNNNNHVRLESLSEYFENSYFLVIFRNPLSHAASLLNQHKNFVNVQTKDPFILEYMNMIGHMEFGLGARPFTYEEQKSSLGNKSKNLINYWLAQWIDTHNWLLNKKFFNRKNIKLVCYEKLCSDQLIYKNLCNFIGLKNYKSGLPFKESKNLKTDFNVSEILLNKANNIYLKLKELS